MLVPPLIVAVLGQLGSQTVLQAVLPSLRTRRDGETLWPVIVGALGLCTRKVNEPRFQPRKVQDSWEAAEEGPVFNSKLPLYTTHV
jgi:hypothetical protein